MRYSLIASGIVLLACSCSFLKTKREIQFRKDTIYAEQYGLQGDTIQEFRKQYWSQKQEGGRSRIEIFADDIFYWHPDSGIQSRKGNVKVKIKLEQMGEQLFLQHTDTSLAKINSGSVAKGLYTAESLTSTEKVLEKKEGLNMKWKFPAIWIFLFLLVSLGLKILSR